MRASHTFATTVIALVAQIVQGQGCGGESFCNGGVPLAGSTSFVSSEDDPFGLTTCQELFDATLDAATCAGARYIYGSFCCQGGGTCNICAGFAGTVEASYQMPFGENNSTCGCVFFYPAEGCQTLISLAGPTVPDCCVDPASVSPPPTPPPPSPPPTPPPSLPPPPSSPEAADPCFDSNSTATLANGTVARLDMLKAGDAIFATTSDGSLTTGTLSFLSHADASARATFVVLSTADGRKLTLTPQHHVPTGPARRRSTRGLWPPHIAFPLCRHAPPLSLRHASPACTVAGAVCCSNLKLAKDVVVGDTVYVAGTGVAAATPSAVRAPLLSALSL